MSKQSLTPFHTFHLNANANAVIEVGSLAELQTAWQRAESPRLLLGQGSNVIFVEDFAGTVILNRLKGIQHHEDEDHHFLHIAGGENWHELVKWTLTQGIGGLENLALIPGVVGSAPIQNIGAYGVEFERMCDYVEVIALESGEVFRLSRAECDFGYRESVFKHRYREGYAIIAVGLKLAKAWRPVLNYGPLGQFDENTVSPQQIFDAVCEVRRSKLPDPDELGNAGSFFKNPIVDHATFQRLQQTYPTMPHYPQADGSVKLPAGWLIDQAQLKGYRVGGAMVHTKQALVLVNQHKATGNDVVGLAKAVRAKVREQFGVELHPEVRFIGRQGEIDSEEITR